MRRFICGRPQGAPPRIIVFILMGFMTAGLSAQEMINTGGANFLNVPTDARSAAMAGTGVALAENNSAVFHNAAAVFGSDVNRGGVTYSYTPWMRDFMEDYDLHTVSGFYKLNSRHAVLAGFRYYGYPSITASDDSKLKPKEWALEVGYSYRVLKGLSVSATVRYIMSSLGAVDDCDGASTVAVDLGAYYHQGFDGGRGDWSVGAQLSNVGGKLSYLTSEESLPTSLRFGVGGRYRFSEYHRLSLTADLVSRFEPGDVSGVGVSAGGEYVVLDMFALRGGYHYGDKAKADYSYASAGAGVMVYGATVDFAWLFGDEDCTFRNSWFVTLGYRF